jgi:predicted outer membrane repeat protein
MDQTQFDRIARLLGGAVSRRAGIGAALAALTGSRIAADADAKNKGTGRKPGTEGPCGNGKRKANICTKNSDCCTGLCNTKAGKKNKDGKGRCRCIQNGKACKSSKNCCNTLTCNDGVCGSVAPETCLVCASGCPYSTVDAAWAATADGGTISVDAGTYPTAIEIDKSMTVEACNGVTGVILEYVPGEDAIFWDPGVALHAVTLKGLTLEEVGTNFEGLLVSLSGFVTLDATDCTFRNASNGIEGSGNANTSATFTGCSFVGNDSYGVYATTLDLTFIDCDFSKQGYYGLYASGPADATLTDCTFTEDEYGVNITGPGLIAIDGCTFTGAIDGALELDIATITLTNSTFTGNTMPLVINESTATIDGCTFTGNTGSYGTGMALGDGTYTVTNTTISGNTASGGGGGIYANASVANMTLTLGTGVSITGNSAPEGSGILAIINGKTMTITGAQTSVTGNLVGDQCETGPNLGGPYTPVANCAF